MQLTGVVESKEGSKTSKHAYKNKLNVGVSHLECLPYSGIRRNPSWTGFNWGSSINCFILCLASARDICCSGIFRLLLLSIAIKFCYTDASVCIKEVIVWSLGRPEFMKWPQAAVATVVRAGWSINTFESLNEDSATARAFPELARAVRSINIKFYH